MDRLGGLGGIFGTQDDPAPEDFDFGEAEFDHDAESPPAHIGQDERRMQVRAYNHWASQLEGHKFPLIDDLDPAAIEDFGPYSVLLDFSAGIENPAIRHLGEKLAEECGTAEGIERLEDVPSLSLLSRITDHYMQILANEAPIGFEAEFVNQRGLTALYRGILLPYSSDDATIDYIYGVINWKEIADPAMADALLAELDQALDREKSINPSTAEGLLDLAQFAEADPITDLSGDDETALPHDLPEPDFGLSPAASRDASPVAPADPETGVANASDDQGEDTVEDVDWGHGFSGFDEDEPVFTVDYGENGLEDENDAEDVEGVVNPLDDDSVGAGLSALVTRGGRTAPRVSLPTPFGGEVDPDLLEDQAGAEETGDAQDIASGETSVDDSDNEGRLATQSEIGENGEDEDLPETGQADEAEGLYDCLAAAREMAQIARSSEDRSRKALYQAVGRAYDFSIEAQASPADFDELMAENGLAAQDRAPMTPVIKLVFGADYDKTRIAEYATVLSYAHRTGVQRGQLAEVLRKAEGGLKAIIQAERQARREAQGKPPELTGCIRESLARKLRQIEGCTLSDLPEQGTEFALVMLRRKPDGSIAILGEVPEERTLLERAARKLLG